MEIGLNGNGSLTIQNGGAVNVVSTFGVSAQIYATDGSGNGTLTVNGGTLSATGGDIYVGSIGSGTATMTIENGGVVTTTALGEIGPTSFFGETSTGRSVTGAGST